VNPKEKDKGLIQTPKKKAPRIAHIENRLNIVQLDTGDIDALQNGLCLWKGNIPAFHSHAAIDIFVPFLFGKEQTLLRGHVKSVWIMHDASAPSAAGFILRLYHRRAMLHKGKFQIRMGTAQFLGAPSINHGIAAAGSELTKYPLICIIIYFDSSCTKM